MKDSKGPQKKIEREEFASFFKHLDPQLRKTIQRQGVLGCTVTQIQRELGDVAVIRAGILVAENKLRIIGGGGPEPYRLALGAR